MNTPLRDASSTRRVAAPALTRLAGFAVDGATYLIIPALLLPLGLLLRQRGVMLSSVAVNAIGFALVIAPATIWAAWWEALTRGATPGKLLMRVRVIDERTRAMPSARQALVRNMIKIALPWELGHTVALGLADAGSQVPLWLWVLTAIMYGWVLGNVLMLVLSSRKPLHDRVAGTAVVRTTA